MKMIDLRVCYMSYGKINAEFEKEILAVAKKYDLRQCSSGFCSDNKIRNLKFEMIIFDKDRVKQISKKSQGKPKTNVQKYWE